MVAGVGCVAGVGFTVSLFIAGLSFPGSAVLSDDAKVGILVASVVAAAAGVLVLIAATRSGVRDADAKDAGAEEVEAASG